MRRLEIQAFADAALDDAAALLAARHRAQRAVAPGLPRRFEAPAAARDELAALRAQARASGWVAAVDGRLVGYLLGAPREDAMWGPNVWVEAAGHAVAEAEDLRDLYAVAAARWVAEGWTYHYALVPATDAALVDAWFRLGFGQQHVHALCETAGVGGAPAIGGGGGVPRRATAADLDDLAALDLVLPRHQALSPVFAPGGELSLAEARADWAASLAETDSATFVAELDGRVVGSAYGCPVTRSGAHSGLARPDDAAILAFAAVLPEARGHGVGRRLGEAVLRWSAAEGYRRVVTDWRATNLLSSRSWPRLGFRPTFLRLHRRI